MLVDANVCALSFFFCVIFSWKVCHFPSKSMALSPGKYGTFFERLRHSLGAFASLLFDVVVIDLDTEHDNAACRRYQIREKQCPQYVGLMHNAL